MSKLRDKLAERRRYLRLKVPIKMAYTVPGTGKVSSAVSKDISADGIGFDTHNKSMKEGDVLELKLDIAGTSNPIHSKGRVIWKKRLSLEDNAPFDIGLEITEIEEDNKNTFLKFLCDQIYALPKEKKHANSKT